MALAAIILEGKVVNVCCLKESQQSTTGDEMIELEEILSSLKEETPSLLTDMLCFLRSLHLFLLLMKFVFSSMGRNYWYHYDKIWKPCQGMQRLWKKWHKDKYSKPNKALLSCEIRLQWSVWFKIWSARAWEIPSKSKKYKKHNSFKPALLISTNRHIKMWSLHVRFFF